MCGGDSEDYARVEPAISAYARFCCLMGPSGAAKLTKMVNQICIAGLVQALPEGLRFARVAGLDQPRVVDVIAKGRAQSWPMDNQHKKMIAGKFNFGSQSSGRERIWRFVLMRRGAAVPVTALVDQFYGEVQAKGGGRWDTSSLITRL
jgi:3-hydroxyisobutyrate dehydrogenase